MLSSSALDSPAADLAEPKIKSKFISRVVFLEVNNVLVPATVYAFSIFEIAIRILLSELLCFIFQQQYLSFIFFY